jgi:4-hydroxy-tetrahydrodipicolinate reductase
MGRTVERLALERGHTILRTFDVDNPLDTVDDPKAAGIHEADALIDFTLPDVVLGNIERYCRWNATAVIGTTGWYDKLETVRRLVEESEAAILYAPNFSIGVALLVHALKAIGPLLNDLPEFDPCIHEVHHVRKVDSPSGTAVLLAEVLLEALDRKKRIETETQHQRIDASALHVTSARVGNVIGKHTVTIDSPFDQIELAHQAKNRDGFAYGALKAAEWVQGKKGLFTLDDMLGTSA